VAYHETFWVAVAAAAPIIALANQVTLSDQAMLAVVVRAVSSFRALGRDPRVPHGRIAVVLAVAVYSLGYYNMLAQVWMLFVALMSLAHSYDRWTVKSVAGVLGLGLLVVVLTSVGSAAVKILSTPRDTERSVPELEAPTPSTGTRKTRAHPRRKPPRGGDEPSQTAGPA
jgi:hypothetical protein